MSFYEFGQIAILIFGNVFCYYSLKKQREEVENYRKEQAEKLGVNNLY